MRSVRHPSFNKRFAKLTPDQQTAARQAFEQWKQDPQRVGWHLLAGMSSPLYAAKVGYGNRAMAVVAPNAQGEMMACWFWIGSHEDYNNEMKQIRQRSVRDLTQGLTPAQQGHRSLGQVLQAKAAPSKSSPSRSTPCRTMSPHRSGPKG